MRHPIDATDVLDRLTRHIADDDADPGRLATLVRVTLGHQITHDQAQDLIQQATYVLLFEQGLGTWADFTPDRPRCVPRWLDDREDETISTYAWLLRDVTKALPTVAAAS